MGTGTSASMNISRFSSAMASRPSRSDASANSAMHPSSTTPTENDNTGSTSGTAKRRCVR